MPSKTQSILIGGLVVGVLNTSVLQVTAVLCCAGVIIGAMAGVWHYTTTYELTISAGQGVLIGVLAAALGAVIAGILNYVLALAGLNVLGEMAMNFVEGANLPPEQVETLRESMDVAGQGIGAVLLGIAANAFVFAIFGAIGGAIGASVFKRGGDTPGGPGGGSGGPRTPAGGGPRPDGPQQERTPPQPSGPSERERSESSPYRPAREEEEEAAVVSS